MNFSMKTKGSFLLLAACSSILGCAGTDVTQLKPGVAKAHDCDLPIFAAESEVPQKFETVCVVEARTGTGWIHDRSAAAAIKKARPKLCECGADAAIIVEATSMQGSDWTATTLTPMQDIRGNAKIRGIRYLQSPGAG
jgi:hypothetical protein